MSGTKVECELVEALLYVDTVHVIQTTI